MFSYVITHRSSTNDRKRNLDYLIEYITNTFTGVEIIVVEQDNEERYFNGKCVKVFIRDGGLFSRSKCLNEGFNKATHDKILFADNDLLIPVDQINDSLILLDSYECVNPYTDVRDMSEADTINVIRTNDIHNIRNYSNRGGIVFSGGACFFTREGYARIGGYDEEFIGWGGEDNACSHKIHNVLKHIQIDGYCLHMHHDRTQSNELHSHYTNNISYLNKIMSMNASELVILGDVKRKIHGW